MTEAQLINKLNELRSLPAETEVFEFKEAKNSFDFNKLGKYFSALCNEANLKGKQEAWLIFGVENSIKNIVGSNFRHNNRPYLDSLKSEVANKTTNRITFIEIYELNLPEGRVVMFQIPPAPQGIPIAWEGHYYGRDGEVLVPLNTDEYERIRSQTTLVDWSSGICEGATTDDIEPAAILSARENFKIKNPRIASEVNNWTDISFLDKAKITINGQITHTAIILLGKTESEHYIAPGISQITWVLRDKDNMEKDYEHFTCPFILAVDKIFVKIRNLKYRYMKEGTLFPEEIEQYEPLNIKEVLSNCIAHQDYLLGGRITVTEREDGYLTFVNLGGFIPGTIEAVIKSDSPPNYYRNHFLAKAMVNLNLIDTIGFGIKRMFQLQSKRYFPLPDYEIANNKVKVTLIGKQMDINYARKLAQIPNLTLEEIILLDKVQKEKQLEKSELQLLRQKGLVEGRKGLIHISASIAQTTGQTVDYMKSKGVDKDFIRKTVKDYLKRFDETRREVFESILLSKLSDQLSIKQKKTKIRNTLQAMRKEGIIIIDGKLWKLSSKNV